MELDEQYIFDTLADFKNIDVSSRSAVQDFKTFIETLIEDTNLQLEWARLIYTEEPARQLLNELLKLFSDGILSDQDSYYHIIYDFFDLASYGLLEPSVFDEFFQTLRVSELRALFHHLATNNGESYSEYLLKYIFPHELLREGEVDYPEYLKNITDLSHYFEDPDFITSNQVLLNAAYDQMLDKLTNKPYDPSPLKILLNRSFDYYDNTEMLIVNYNIHRNVYTGMFEIDSFDNKFTVWLDFIDRVFGPYLAEGKDREDIYNDVTLQIKLRQTNDELRAVKKAQEAINRETFIYKAGEVKEYLTSIHNPHASNYVEQAVEYILDSTEYSHLSPYRLNNTWYHMLITALENIISDDPLEQGTITPDQFKMCKDILLASRKNLTQIVMDAFISPEASIREKLALRNLNRYRGEPDPPLEEFPLKK